MRHLYLEGTALGFWGWKIAQRRVPRDYPSPGGHTVRSWRESLSTGAVLVTALQIHSIKSVDERCTGFTRVSDVIDVRCTEFVVP